MSDPTRNWLRTGCATAALLGLTACTTVDFDLRGDFVNGLDTSEAATAAAEGRPRADDRGVISYPDFQVVLARRGDTVRTVADRLGLNAEALARYNGLRPDDQLRVGEVLSLPSRVAEPSAATGASTVDISALAGNAIDRAEVSGSAGATSTGSSQTGLVPIQHQVERGETAYSIARLYGVSVRSLADWNALDENLTVREGQFLLVPVSQSGSVQTSELETPNVTQPGEGSPTPTPPSASQPLPDETEEEAAAAPPPSPELGNDRTEASGTARLSMPVQGSIIAGYEKGRNEGIDIAASPGTPVKAAGAGTVAAITRDTDQVPILVIRHAGNLLTVYANIDNITVEKGQSVSAGQTIASIRNADPSFLHFEVREGFESADPMDYLN
ncbi:MAG: peptidoglycan DD-metalloendopeptidase family protein [Paracoccaceae bacterium]